MDLRFTCQPGCTNCCDQDGYVYLSEDDLKRAAKFVGMSAKAFEARYVYRTRHQRAASASRLRNNVRSSKTTAARSTPPSRHNAGPSPSGPSWLSAAPPGIAPPATAPASAKAS